MTFMPGMKVVAVNDHGSPPSIGEIVRLLRRKPIGTLHEGAIEHNEIYLVRWRMPDGRTATAEAPAVSLRALPTKPR